MNPGRKNFRSALAMLLALMLLFAACSSNNSSGNNSNNNTPPTTTPPTTSPPKNETPSAPPPVKNPDPVTLVLHTWHVGADQRLYDKFHEMYPWITIEPNTKINKAIINNVIAGETSDLVYLDAGLSQWLTGDLLEDLTPYILKDERIQKANIVDGFLDSFKTGGKWWTIPRSDIPYWVLVNKEMLKKYGMEMPPNNWTYDDFLEMAKKATNISANDWGIIGMDGLLSTMLAMANGSADNDRYMNKTVTASLLHTPAVLEDLKWVQELTTRWHVRPNKEEREQYGLKGDPVDDVFLKGNVLFALGADWNLPGLKEHATFDWDVMPMPRGKVRQTTIHQAGPISIPKASKHKEEAFLYISFLFSKEAQKILIENGSNSFLKDPDLLKYYEEVDIWKGKNAKGIAHNASMCCFSVDPNIVDLNSYLNSAVRKMEAMLDSGGNFSEFIPAVEAYNKQAIETRKALGW